MLEDADFRPAGSKLEAVRRISAVVGRPPAELGPGSKERKSTLTDLATGVGVEIDPDAPKTDLGRAIARHLHVEWDDNCWSAGHTITLDGLNRLLEAAEWHVRRHSGETMALPYEHDNTERSMLDPSNLVTRSNQAEDARTTLEISAAEPLAVLSHATETPNDVAPAKSPFSDGDVDFSSESWMARVADVQEWLLPPERLPVDDIARFRDRFAEMLGYAREQEAYVPGTPRLTDKALDRLRSRAESAVEAHRAFVEALEEENGTRHTATQVWRANWAEIEDLREPDYAPEPVSAKTSTWNVDDFAKLAELGRLDLAPSYQRGDVWPTKDAQMLIESILRGIPLPSIIILRRRGSSAGQSEVVDGKQRLTAILRFMGKHPRAVETVNEFHEAHPGQDLKEMFQNDYPSFRQAWKNLRGETLTASRERELYFPFRLRTDEDVFRGSLRAFEGKYYSQIRNEDIQIADSTESIWEIFEHKSNYTIPVIEYSRATQRQIHQVFNLYNKQGKHLNAEEIRNAIFHELAFTRGVLCAAGDADEARALSDVAPFLQPAWDEIAPLQATLADYRFGTTRYKRTKVLSWILSVLLLDPREDGKPRFYSTAKHIDTLFERIQGDPGDPPPDDPLQRERSVRDALVLVARATEAHAANDGAWAPSFKDGSAGARWQELQLVGSITGVAMAAVLDPYGVEEQVADAAAELYKASLQWQRPLKTQTKEQWKHIAEIAKGVVEVLGTDVEEVDKQLVASFGGSGIGNLWAVMRDDADS